MTTDKELQSLDPKDIVTWEDLARQQALDEASTRYVGEEPSEDDDEPIRLLDPLIAYGREAERQRRAGRRNRSLLTDVRR